MAYLGEPFDFDFNYTAKSPPSSHSWYKDGQPFRPDETRVITDHMGIIFTRIRQGDDGQYSVRAHTPGFGSATANITLMGK